MLKTFVQGRKAFTISQSLCIKPLTMKLLLATREVLPGPKALM